MLKLHYNLEKVSMGLVGAIIFAASIGGIVEIAPLFMIEETIQVPEDMRPHTPLELAGREIYIREGCYACHSQMVRSLADELDRYGPYSLAAESVYDHPMLWDHARLSLAYALARYTIAVPPTWNTGPPWCALQPRNDRGSGE